MRSPRPLAALLLALVAPAGCDDERGSGTAERRPAPVPAELRGAPPELAALHRQANRLLDGGPEAFRRQIARLRGRPVVVNKWASWCPPCRAEFPFFASQARKRGRAIAFLGVDSTDSDDGARKFLAENPVPYPSYRDPEGDVARVFRGAVAFPSTAFYDRDGRLATVKQGGYRTEGDLATDIRRYAR